jgi:hypothetical protein
MDANANAEGGAVEPKYMLDSANHGDPYGCLYKRILVLPNRAAPSGFRLHEILSYFHTVSAPLPPSRRTVKRKKVQGKKKQPVIKSDQSGSRNRTSSLPSGPAASLAPPPDKSPASRVPMDSASSMKTTSSPPKRPVNVADNGTAHRRQRLKAKHDASCEKVTRDTEKAELTKHPTPIAEPPPPSQVPPSPRAVKTARSLRGRNTGGITASLVSVMRAKVKKAALSIFSPDESKVHAATILRNIAETNEGAIAICTAKDLVPALLDICESGPVLTGKSEPGVLELCLHTLTGVCNSCTRMQRSDHILQRFLQSAVKCTMLLVCTSLQGGGELVGPLAAVAILLNSLSDLSLSTGKEMFLRGGGVTILLALSNHDSKIVARPARRALAAYDETDFDELQSPSFQLLPSCPLMVGGGAAALARMASEALVVESAKRATRKKRELALVKQRSQQQARGPQRALAQRASKLEEWIEQRNLKFEVEKEAWKMREEEKRVLDKGSEKRRAQREMEERRLREIAAEEYSQRLHRKHKEQRIKRQETLESERKHAEEDYARKKKLSNEKVKQWMERKKTTNSNRSGRSSGSGGGSRLRREGLSRFQVGVQVTGSGFG